MTQGIARDQRRRSTGLHAPLSKLRPCRHCLHPRNDVFALKRTGSFERVGCAGGIDQLRSRATSFMDLPEANPS